MNEYSLNLTIKELCFALKLTESERTMITEMPVAYQYKLQELASKVTPVVTVFSTAADKSMASCVQSNLY